MTFRVRVRYPLEGRRGLVLRTDLDWERDVEPCGVSDDGTEFLVPGERGFLYFKPLLVETGKPGRWSAGQNYLALSGTTREVYPHFERDDRCSACEPRRLGGYEYRVFTPPGYHENALKRYPVVYMQDGQNLFFPQESFSGRHWRVAETLTLLDAMSLVDKVLVVGVYPNRRELDYTKPGYDTYGRFLVEVLKPAVDGSFRTLPGPETTAVMGSSLGGVVSMYVGWQWPETFGMVAAMSSTFGWKDDLAERVASEPKRPLRVYLDSGWPNDNYEATRDLHVRLLARGYSAGRELFYLAFPEALHDEAHWAMRCHVPFQFLFGRESASFASVSAASPGEHEAAVGVSPR